MSQHRLKCSAHTAQSLLPPRGHPHTSRGVFRPPDWLHCTTLARVRVAGTIAPHRPSVLTWGSHQVSPRDFGIHGGAFDERAPGAGRRERRARIIRRTAANMAPATIPAAPIAAAAVLHHRWDVHPVHARGRLAAPHCPPASQPGRLHGLPSCADVCAVRAARRVHQPGRRCPRRTFRAEKYLAAGSRLGGRVGKMRGPAVDRVAVWLRVAHGFRAAISDAYLWSRRWSC